MPKPMTIAALAEKCADAYSTDNYRGGWAGCIRMLMARGFGEREIEAIIRSKWTRWAADQSGKPYGRNTGTDLARFLDTNKRTGRDDVAELVLETFSGTGE